MAHTITDAYDILFCYTLAHGDPAFIHQHVVDTWAAQHADAQTKPIRLVFALIGLCLHLERQFTGRDVQRAHMALAKRRRDWPVLPLPSDRGAITPIDVLTAPEGEMRDAMIDAWCGSVWNAFIASAPTIRTLLDAHALSRSTTRLARHHPHQRDH